MTQDTAIDEVRDQVAAWLAAFNERDRDSLFALFHPEMIYANDGAALMRGATEVRSWYEQAFGAMSSKAFFIEEAVVPQGDTALVVGKFCFDSGSSIEETGRVAMLWRRGDEGQWLLAFDMDNRPPDSVPGDFASRGSDYYMTPEARS